MTNPIPEVKAGDTLFLAQYGRTQSEPTTTEFVTVENVCKKYFKVVSLGKHPSEWTFYKSDWMEACDHGSRVCLYKDEKSYKDATELRAIWDSLTAYFRITYIPKSTLEELRQVAEILNVKCQTKPKP